MEDSPGSLIYESETDFIKKWWKELTEEFQAQEKARYEFMDRMTERFGVGEDPDSIRAGIRGLVVSQRNFKVYGLAAGLQEIPLASSGWRMAAGQGFWRPNRHTRAGKLHYASMQTLDTFDLENKIRDVGINWVYYDKKRLTVPQFHPLPSGGVRVTFDNDSALLQEMIELGMRRWDKAFQWGRVN